jgi:hypothetical protein
MKLRTYVPVFVIGLAAVPLTATADTTVFRCTEPGGRVLYTDYPCRNANVVELHAGKADTAAAARLARAQAALDAGMEQWRAEDARDAARRAAFADARDLAAAAQPPAPVPVDDYGPVYWGLGPVWPQHLRDKPPRRLGPGTGRPPVAPMPARSPTPRPTRPPLQQPR